MVRFICFEFNKQILNTFYKTIVIKLISTVIKYRLININTYRKND